MNVLTLSFAQSGYKLTLLSPPWQTNNVLTLVQALKRNTHSEAKNKEKNTVNHIIITIE